MQISPALYAARLNVIYPAQIDRLTTALRGGAEGDGVRGGLWCPGGDVQRLEGQGQRPLRVGAA